MLFIFRVAHACALRPCWLDFYTLRAVFPFWQGRVVLRAMTSLTFFHDFISQPTRAVGLLLGAAKIEHVKHPLKVTEGGWV